ncbi:hypothetical protein EGW08_003622, partial [Elysia chlorotica]
MQSSVADKAHGAQHPPDRLRLRIVEMAEKRSRSGSGNKATSNPRELNPTINSGHVSNLMELKNNEREIRGEVFRPPVVNRVGLNRGRINLELPKTQKPIQDQHEQECSLYNRVVVLDGGSHRNGNAKDKASAWLLKRFRQRRFLNGGERAGNCAPNLAETILPSPAEPTKRFHARSGPAKEKATPVEYQHQGKNRCLSTTPDEDAESTKSSLTLTTHFPSNDLADAKKQRRPEASDFCNGRYFHQTDNMGRKNESKDSFLGRDKQVNPNRLCELKGNALTTPPPRQNPSRKPGLFSASLDVFRRRLKLTANKYSDRLNNDNVDRTEDYVIRADTRVRTADLNKISSHKPYGFQTPALVPRPSLPPQRPSSEMRRVDTKMMQPYLQRSKEHDIYKNINSNEIKPNKNNNTNINNNSNSTTTNNNNSNIKDHNDKNININPFSTNANIEKDRNITEEERKNIDPVNSK